MMVYHGVSDSIFSPDDTAAWYDGLKANDGGDASNFARFYRVPGMSGQCRRRQRRRAGAWSATRTRPLCPYPKVARYNGSGDVELAGSFTCQ